MPTMEESVAALTTATTGLIAEVQTKKVTLDTAVENAQTSETNAATSETNAATSETNAATSAASAAANAATTSADVALIDTNITAINNVSNNMASILAQYAVGPIEPTTPYDGQQWFDTLTRQIKMWDGGSWNVIKITSFSPTIAYSFGRKTLRVSDGDRVLDNVGTDGGTIDLYGSNHLKLDSALGEELPIPFDIALGTEVFPNPTFDLDASGWDLSGWVWDAGGYVTSTDGSYLRDTLLPVVIGDEYILEIEVVNYTADCTLTIKYGTSAGNRYGNIYVTGNGTYRLGVVAMGDRVYIYPTNGIPVSITKVSMKPLTSNTKAISYYSPDSKSNNVIALDGRFSNEQVHNSTFDGSVEGFTSVIWDGSRAKIEDTGSTKTFDFDSAFPLNTIPGQTYILKLDVELGSFNSIRVLNNSIGLYLKTITTDGVHYVRFIAATSHDDWRIYWGSSEAGTGGYINEASIKRCLPLVPSLKHIDNSSNITVLNEYPTQTDLDYIDEQNPEAIAQLVSGESVSELSFTADDVYSYYPCNEGLKSGQFIHNVKNPMVETSVNPDFLTADITNFSAYPSYVIENNILKLNGNNSSGEYIRTAANKARTLYWCEVILDGTSPYPIPTLVRVAGTTNGHIFGSLTQDPSNPLRFTGLAYSPTYDNWYFTVGVTIGEQCWFKRISTKEIDASQIQNYTDACRTTFENTNYGLSRYLIKEDLNTGRLLGVASDYTAEMHGANSVITTDYIPTDAESFVIEVIMFDIDFSTVKHIHSCYGSGAGSYNRVGFWGGNKSIRLDALQLNGYLKPVVDAGSYVFAVRYSKSENSSKGWSNGVLLVDNIITTATNAVIPIRFGNDGNSTPNYIETPLGLCRIFKGEAAELYDGVKEYARLQALYPTKLL